MKILVAGAGYVGAELARQARAAGHAVFALRRKPEPLGEGIETLAADLMDPASLRGLPAVDVLAYTAAADDSSEASYQRAYVDGLANVLAATGDARVLFTSSTAVYAQDDGSVVDESSEVTPRDNARFLLEGEAQVHARGGTVLRLAGIYGPGRDRIVRMVKEGTARLGSGAFGNRIHRDDCAGALLHLAGLHVAGQQKPAPIYVGVDEAPVLLDEVYRWVADALGVPTPPSGDPDARAKGTGRKRASSALLKRTGYRFRYPSFREGYGEAIALHR